MHFIPAVQLLEAPSAQAWCFAFVEGRLLLREDQTLLPWDSDLPHERHYLGRLGGVDVWTFRLDVAPPTGWVGQPLRAAMMALPGPLQALAGVLSAFAPPTPPPPAAHAERASIGSSHGSALKARAYARPKMC